MRREYHKWHSPSLNRDMELLAFGHGGSNVLVFPTRVGRFFDYENWGMVEALRDKIDAGRIRLICVDSVDEESFYCYWNDPKDRVLRHLDYENYILNEVFPFALETNNDQHFVAHGCSLGAFHAINLAFRHPSRFDKVVALSGRYDLASSMGSHRGLFDGYYDENIYFNTPSHYMPNMSDDELVNALRRMEIIFAVGEWDNFLNNNIEFSDILRSKDIPHGFYIWSKEAHKPKYWRQMVKIYL